MRENRPSGSMSGVWKRSGNQAATAPHLDSAGDDAVHAKPRRSWPITSPGCGSGIMRYGGKLPGRMDQLPQLIDADRLQHVLVKASSIAAFIDSRSVVAANGNQEKRWQVGADQCLCHNKAVLCRHCDVYQNQVWTRAPSMVNAFRANLARRHVTAEPFQVFAKEIYGLPLIIDN
jgi:hypothetical protein